MKEMYGVVLLYTEGMAICEDDWENLWCAEMPEEFVTAGDGIEIDGLTPLEDLPMEQQVRIKNELAALPEEYLDVLRMLCYAALEALAEKDFALVFQENEKTALPDTPANEIIAKCAAYIVCVHFGVLPQEVCVRVPTALGTDKIENLLRALSTAQSIAAQEIMVIENRLRSKKWRTI